MRLRALGIAMFCFGIAGAGVSFGSWWIIHRTGKNAADAVGAEVRCVQHCGGVDGPFLAGVVAGGCVALLGLVLTLTLRPSRREGQ